MFLSEYSVVLKRLELLDSGYFNCQIDNTFQNGTLARLAGFWQVFLKVLLALADELNITL